MSTGQHADAFDIDDAKADLSRILDRVERGEEIVISRAGNPVAKVVPVEPPTRRTARGSLAGRIDLSEDRDSAETDATVAGDAGPAS
jgi:prevent-host-death family protein